MPGRVALILSRHHVLDLIDQRYYWQLAAGSSQLATGKLKNPKKKKVQDRLYRLRYGRLRDRLVVGWLQDYLYSQDHSSRLSK